MDWPNIPPDVVDWFRSCFREANERATAALENLPNIRESSLDDQLVDSLIPRSAPTRLPSNTIVSMQIHNIGGLRALGRWETADIAVLVHVLVKGHPVAQKIGLLQSKRLYPNHTDIDELDSFDFRIGVNGLFWPEPKTAARALHRNFDFSESCRYKGYDAAQQVAIDDFNPRFGQAIFYLFYNPSRLPLRVKYPIESYRTPATYDLGCRVSTAKSVGIAARRVRGSGGPSRRAVRTNSTSNDWRLEHWAADLLLTCKVGQPYGSADEGMIYRMIERRSGPIGAAIRTTIDLPNEN